MSDELCRAVAEAQQRADSWERKCITWQEQCAALERKHDSMKEMLGQVCDELETTARQRDTLAAEKLEAVGALSRALQESQAQRDELAAMLDGVRAELTSYRQWWPFDVTGERVYVCLGEGDGPPWHAVFRHAADAARWNETAGIDDAYHVETGEMQGLRFWNSFEPAPPITISKIEVSGDPDRFVGDLALDGQACRVCLAFPCECLDIPVTI